MHVLFKVEQVQPNCLHHIEGSHPDRAAVTDNSAEVQAKIHLLREKRLHTFTKKRWRNLSPDLMNLERLTPAPLLSDVLCLQTTCT